MDLISLSGKVALITGASSGIGKAAAILFAKLGAGIALVGRNEENLNKTRVACEEVSPSSSNAVFCAIKADLGDLQQISAAFSQTIQKFGRLDILVNNAGIQIKDSVENFDPIAHDRIMNLNVRSVLTLSHLAVPKLTESKGCIVNISSVSGNNSFPGIISYAISKAAIEQFTRNAAVELGAKGIRVNCVAPGVIVTQLHRNAGMSEVEYSAFLARAQNNNLMGHVGEPGEIAKAIVYLASGMGSFVTGETIFVDGGWSKMCPR